PRRRRDLPGDVRAADDGAAAHLQVAADPQGAHRLRLLGRRPRLLQGPGGIAARARLRGQAAEPHRDSDGAARRRSSARSLMTQATPAVGTPLPPLPGEAQPPRPAPAPAAASTLSVPETRAAARHDAETVGRYQVQIHAETMRIITEVVDMQTGDVLMY